MELSITYTVDKVWFRDFDEMVREILAKQPPISERIPLRIVFFGAPDNNAQYTDHLNRITRLVWEHYCDAMPLVSYVAQRPLDCALAAEVQSISPRLARHYTLTRKHYEDSGRNYNYITLERKHTKYLFTEGLLPDDLGQPMNNQSEHVLGILEAILAAERMPVNSIVRQWNYIENITRVSCDAQHYQAFNDARSRLYGTVSWPAGYPAATGIGTQQGGIMVEVDAAVFGPSKRRSMAAVDNTLQVAAHDYSPRVLIGEEHSSTTPKFERAKALLHKRRPQMVYISGTAAIRGEESLTGVGIERQTVITQENMDFLISKENLHRHKIRFRKNLKIRNFRVYLKSENFLDTSRRMMLERYGNQVGVVYVFSDVCREELLIEIEGVAR